MTSDRVSIVESALDRYLERGQAAARILDGHEPVRPGSKLKAEQAIEIFEDQVRSRAIDVAARRLKKSNESYYTISSAGHEDNAVIGAQLRTTDPCFLHYRSGALMMARGRKIADSDPLMATLLSLCASADDPASGGRHKVWGSVEGWVPPQTSTIASHVPKALGAAFAIGRSQDVGLELAIPDDSIVMCSFGDASANHATALAGINSARWSHRRGMPTPLLLVCEDNGVGISVPTPRRWIEDTYSAVPGLHYFRAGGELDDIWETVGDAIDTCRTSRAPVFLHLETVRLWGHAGSDVESAYRSRHEIEAAESKDPILRTAKRLVGTGAAAPEFLRRIVCETRDRVTSLSVEASARPKLQSREMVMAPLISHNHQRLEAELGAHASLGARKDLFGRRLPEDETTAVRRTMAAHINACLKDEMLARSEMLVFGEDVAHKGGVYNVTSGMRDAFGPHRVFDTPLDETTILGVAQGSALLGFLPVPEIQYLAYIHNALDQLRGEACSTSFFSGGQYRNPMVVRVAAFAYQKGFGGHFHNDNSVGALRDIPGLIVATPSKGDDAARMLRGCLALARAEGRVVAFMEPIALYHEKDLYESGDGLWLSSYPPPSEAILPGDVGIFEEGDADALAILTYGNGVRMALQAARLLRDKGLPARVIDLRWLRPLPLEAITHHVAACGAVLVVDECRATGGGIADAVVAHVAEEGLAVPSATVRSADSYIPLGPAADSVLVTVDQIVERALQLLDHPEESSRGCGSRQARSGVS